ncbi:OB-fold domain-containing protein [Herbaspirillum lusitanum]|uniref:OB-fold domain-containing protein n=1 Tax=Herbaspirillum lusitanum TaxID=213312 RepID=A0ABW9ACZ5_9BURK
MKLRRVMPDPVISPETQAFWDAAAEGRFLVRRCSSCNKVHWYPRTMCPFCSSLETAWEPGAGTGTIYTYSVMRRAKELFVMAYVSLSEGPQMMTNIVDCDPDALRVGDPVELVFVPSENGFAVPCFRPAQLNASAGAQKSGVQ